MYYIQIIVISTFSYFHQWISVFFTFLTATVWSISSQTPTVSFDCHLILLWSSYFLPCCSTISKKKLAAKNNLTKQSLCFSSPLSSLWLWPKGSAGQDGPGCDEYVCCCTGDHGDSPPAFHGLLSPLAIFSH